MISSSGLTYVHVTDPLAEVAGVHIVCPGEAHGPGEEGGEVVVDQGRDQAQGPGGEQVQEGGRGSQTLNMASHDNMH